MPGREQKNGTNGTNGSNGTTGYGEATLPEKQGRGGEGWKFSFNKPLEVAVVAPHHRFKGAHQFRLCSLHMLAKNSWNVAVPLSLLDSGITGLCLVVSSVSPE
ncbi:hypothetical protein AXG93_2415s1060 [Marchantia polymorpha subsp. ruderalis]|uniref:Uncharacterized protein n=1 Tax=Marchantia polymorpha subsp. ruderalis TaxID=1480154 RepID=A0A176VUU1_MARPO|nr:hypothetical protein AXG93_2415s1060 [Marchantia polymorpha subsp. ruderalis]